MIHEVGHAIQYMKTETKKGKQLPIIDDHGHCWEKILRNSTIRGNLKKIAFLQRSPDQKCLFKGSCQYCLSDDTRMSNEVTKLYSAPDESQFDRACEQCTEDFSRPVSHLLKSEDCKKWYEQNYGEKLWKDKVKRDNAKIKRRAKRTTTCKSVCSYCNDKSDWNLPMHLKYKKKCRSEYMTEHKTKTFGDLLIEIEKDRKMKNQQDCRARKRLG